MGFPTKNDHFGVFWGYHHLRKHPYIEHTTTFQGIEAAVFLGHPSGESGFLMGGAWFS